MQRARPFITTALAAAIAFTYGCDRTPVEPEHAELSQELDQSEFSAVGVETADVFGQGSNGPVVAQDGATIRRTPNGISVKVSMPTPEPGTYDYPTGGVAFAGPGHPEAFSLWVFIFDPDADETQAGPWTGAFLGGGHVAGGPNLTLSGHISTNTEPFLGNHLVNPRDADVHLAVAPHGALDPGVMPEQIQTPTQPGPDIWWIALFE